MKRCGHCKQTKSKSEFYENKTRKDGFHPQCKECCSLLGKQSYKKNRSKKLLYSKRKGQEIKYKVFSHYGLKCACCGESDIRFLTIDHINNDGNKHRKEIGLLAIYRWLIRNNFPDGFQALCYNCNLGKAKNNGICPHKDIYDGT